MEEKASSNRVSSTPTKQLTIYEWVGFFGMVIGMFMAILDIQIVASSLSDLQAGLSATRTEISWVQTAYLIAEVIMIPLSGFLSRALSTRVVFCISAIGFTLSSIACAVAWNLESMIVFRALQGFLGGAMIPTVFSTIYLLFPPEKRPKVTIFIGLVVTLAPILGPTLGGYITQILSWHWMFLLNVIPGIFVTIMVWKYIHIDQPDYSLLKKFDWYGLVLMTVFLASLEYFLEEGTQKDWFESNLIKTFCIISVIAGGLFFYHCLTTPHPLVDLRAFSNANFSIGCFYSFILGVGLFGSNFLLPSFLAQIRHLNSLQIGYTMAVTGIAQLISAPIAGAILAKKVDLRIILGGGLIGFSIGAYLNSHLTADCDFDQFLLPQAITGFSLLFCFIPINTLALGVLPPDKLKNASGLYNLMRNLGGALGLAILSTLTNVRSTFHYNRLSEHVTSSRPVITQALEQLNAFFSTSTLNSDKISMGFIKKLAQREAMIMAFNDCFLFIVIILVIGVLFLPFMAKTEGDIEHAE